ncbi:MAG TPA: hypothetical protein DCQ92_16315 [Verrucomicrobia subdivision 3 bacterium]|nr:hypothetical protein [Limisphaerales bacterium]
MKCSIEGCPGEYEPRAITHTVRPGGRVVVIDHVPAEVCDVCGDVLFARKPSASWHRCSSAHNRPVLLRFTNTRKRPQPHRDGFGIPVFGRLN